jgi:hypothetical protein
MEHLAGRPDRARQMGQAAEASITDLTWTKIAANLRDALGLRDMAAQ